MFLRKYPKDICHKYPYLFPRQHTKNPASMSSGTDENNNSNETNKENNNDANNNNNNSTRAKKGVAWRSSVDLIPPSQQDTEEIHVPVHALTFRHPPTHSRHSSYSVSSKRDTHKREVTLAQLMPAATTTATAATPTVSTSTKHTATLSPTSPAQIRKMRPHSVYTVAPTPRTATAAVSTSSRSSSFVPPPPSGPPPLYSRTRLHINSYVIHFEKDQTRSPVAVRVRVHVPEVYVLCHACSDVNKIGHNRHLFHPDRHHARTNI